MRLVLGSVLFSLAALAQPLQVTGSFRTRLEAWDWFDGAADSSYAFSGNQLRVGIGQQRDTFGWQVELAVPFLLGLPRDAIAPAPQGQLGLGATYFAANGGRRNAAMLFPKQAYIRLRGLRVGRFEFIDGSELAPKDPTLAWLKRERISQRLVGPFGFSHVMRSFDGAHCSRTHGGVNVTAVAALATRGVFQVDGWGNLKTAIVYGALTGQVLRKPHAGDWRVFGIYYDDWRNVLKTDNRPAPLRAADTGGIRIGTFGGHYLHSAASLDGLAWGVVQTGSWGRLDHRAWAAALEAGWQPPGLPQLKPWLRAGYFRSSGDKNPLDGTHGTFFQLLPTARPYARFPFYNLMNLRDLFAVALLRPHRYVTLRAEVHDLRLAESADLWYLGGGAFQPQSFGYTGRPSGGNHGLANLYDLSSDIQVTKQVTLTAYYAFAAGRLVTRGIYPRGKDGNLAYLELMWRL